MKILCSFGAKYGVPNDGDVIDVRTYLYKNPYRLKHLRNLSGTDPEVAEDIQQTPGFDLSYTEIKQRVLKSEKDIIYIGCTGGHHRSVYIAERLSKELGYQVIHRDFDKGR